MAETNDPRAPRIESRSKVGGPVSFEAYFLRDLYQKGKIDEDAISNIIEENDIQAEVGDVMDVIRDTSGGTLSEDLSRFVSDIAAAVGGRN